MKLAPRLLPLDADGRPADPAAAAAWDRLARGAGVGALFATPAFASAFVAEFGDRGRLDLLALEDSAGRPRGFAPLMRCRVRRGPTLAPRHDYLAGDVALLRRPGRRMLPLRQASPLLGLEAMAMRAAVLAEPDDEADAWRALPAGFAAARGWDVAVLPVEASRILDLSASAREAGLIALVHPLERPMRAIRRVRPSAEIVAGGSGKFRQNVRRAEKFADTCGWRFETRAGSRVAADYEAFAAVAETSWKEDVAADRAISEAVVVPYAGPQRRFVERLFGSGGPEPVLVTARRGTQIGAAILGARTGPTLTLLLLFQNAEAGRESLGRLVLHRIIDWAAQQGVRTIDMNSNAGWTERYADDAPVLHNLVLLRRDPIGWALAAIGRMRGGLR
ncbi:MAG: GNAT family N-acetyltransferase [Rhodobacteraceae bacterium]|nr:MAG: GNAT family N-acetyltransferase [Paracoccaceae bacterium]